MSSEIIVDVFEPQAIKIALGDMALIASLKDTPAGGDYFWLDIEGNTYGIERKEASDYVQSLTTGRLSEQLRKLVEGYNFPILLTEGNFNSNHDGLVMVPGKNGHLINKNIPFMAIMSSLFEIQLSGIYHLHANNQQTTSRLIKGLYEWSQKKEHSLLNARSRINTISGRADDPMWLLMGLPGIGVSLAKALLEMFGSPHAVFMAFSNPNLRPILKQVRGISDAKIDQVREVLLPNVHISGSLNGPNRLGSV